MKGKDIFLGLQHIGNDLIEEAEQASFPVRHRGGFLRRPLLAAALIALMLALVGCGIIYVLSMQDLKLGDRQVTEEWWDEEQRSMVSETVSRQVLTFSGLKGTPNYEAAKEWYEFKQTYDPDWKIYHEYKDAGKLLTPPAEYSLYNIYTPDMQAKIDEITGKYGLNLQGAHVDAVSDKALQAYLGMDDIFADGVDVYTENIGTSYYDGGWFHTDMYMRLNESDFPYKFMLSLYYSPKDCFDSSVCELNETSDWQEWNYTTASGDEVLVIHSPSVWDSWVFCNREDATISLRIETILEWYSDDSVEQVVMTDDLLKQVLDSIDFSIHPQPGDPALLRGPQVDSSQRKQTQDGYSIELKSALTDGKKIFVLLGITAPEGIELDNLHFATMTISPENPDLPMWAHSGSYGQQEDGDGKANTVDVLIEKTPFLQEDTVIQNGDRWTLYIENLQKEIWNEELSQNQIPWEQEGVWKFEFAFDDSSEYRKLEFVEEPITTLAATGWDMEGNDIFEEVTLTALTLRGYGGEAVSTWDKGGLDFADYRSEKYPTVVLTDGRAIRLAGDLSIYYTEKGIGQMIPLDEVDHLLLIDGTKLTPVK